MSTYAHPLPSDAVAVEAVAAPDLAEFATFNSRVEDLQSFDRRPDGELRATAMEASSAMERERAIWELTYRAKQAAAPEIATMLAREPDPSVRWNLLWLALKLPGDAARGMVQKALQDEHREVRDWARLFTAEQAGAEFDSEYQEGVYTQASNFDQTLPLQIAGFAIVSVPGMGFFRVTLAPLWFEYIMGRVLACTNLATFMQELVIEKQLKAYNADGSDHYEIFKFAGMSWPTADGRVQHRYESLSLRDFYQSGKVKDFSAPRDLEVPVILNRAATTSTAALRVRETEIAPPDRRRIPVAASAGGSDRFEPPREVRLINGRIVRSVRGQFFGWASTSLTHFQSAGEVLPGTVQLSNPMHPSVAANTNTYLCGTFRGKLGDWDGDGLADVNLIPCHGTLDGELDLDLDGNADSDPFARRP